MLSNVLITDVLNNKFYVVSGATCSSFFQEIFGHMYRGTGTTPLKLLHFTVVKSHIVKIRS